MSPYQQAALLIAKLDRQSADELLERMPSDQSQAIRNAVLELEEFNDSECDQAIVDFLDENDDEPIEQVPAEDIERHTFDAGTHIESSAAAVVTLDPECSQHSDAGSDRSTADAVPSSFCSTSLEEMLQHDDMAIAHVIQHERSSIVAALLRSTPQKRAANLLRLLNAELQTRVLSHLHVSQHVSPETVEIIADCICDQLASDATTEAERIDGLLGIFRELPEGEQEVMLQSLQRENPVLAQRLMTAVPK